MVLCLAVGSLCPPICPSPSYGLVDCFFNSLIVGVPCSLIDFLALLIVFRLVIFLLLVVQGSEGFLPMPPSWPELQFNSLSTITKMLITCAHCDNFAFPTTVQGFQFLCILTCICLFLRFYLFTFGEGKGTRKRGRETSMCGCLSHAPHRGYSLQPKHAPKTGN